MPTVCRSSPAPSPNRDRQGPSAHALPGEAIALDLLVQIRAWHVEAARRLRDVPIVFAELGEQECPLRRVLELLERLAVEQRSEARLIRIVAAAEASDVVGRHARPGREDE